MSRVRVDANLQHAVRMIGSREEFEIPRSAAVGQINASQACRIQDRTVSVRSIPTDHSATVGNGTG